MNIRQEKLNNAYEYLRSSGKIHTQVEFSEQIGIHHTNLSSAFNGSKKHLTDSFFKKICDKYSDIFNIEYFLGKSDEMLKITSNNATIYVSLLPVSAQGGTLNDFTVSVKDSECEKIISPIKGADWAITVSGDSMSPEYPSGAQILIKKINEKAFIDWGKVYVLDTCNGTVLKILVPSEKDGHVRCCSINTDERYAPFDVSFDDVFGVYRVLLCMSVK